MGNESDWQVAANTADRVGEGPVWVAAESALYWVDVLGQAINRLSLQDGSLHRWAMPEPIGFIVPRRRHPGFIAGLRSGFYALQLEPLGNPEPQLPDNRLNDGKVDARGRLWAGTMPMGGNTPDGSLYRFDADHRWYAIDSGYCVTNGPAFSIEGDRLYHADSSRRVIYRFALGVDGALHDKKIFIFFPEDWGFPDGMTVDADGYLWVAHWDGGRVSRFDPDGQFDRTFFLPASRVTSCTFGGPAFDRLFVTSAREDRPNEPLAGALFELATGISGLPPCEFAG